MHAVVYCFTITLLSLAYKTGYLLGNQANEADASLSVWSPVSQAVKSGLKTTCKCHGVSGSCAVRTCWKQLSPFHDTGRLLKFRYDSAVRVLSVTNAATGEAELAGPRRHGHSPRPMDLVYLEDSPSFCRPSRYSPGTAGRPCSKDTSCQNLCCGRGYNTALRHTTLSCHCQVRWCCHVECQTCLREEEVYTCKKH